MDRVVVTDLDWGDFHRLAALTRVEDGQLAVVATSRECVRVLGVVLQTQHGRCGT